VCRNKAILVAPYENLRLARYLDSSTTDFVARATPRRAAPVLRPQQNSDCGFLDQLRCSVCIRVVLLEAASIHWSAGCLRTASNGSVL
jgi:hypothetical protein